MWITIKNMARSHRAEFPGAIHHITNRGNCKEKIFINDDIRLCFLQLLYQTIKKYGWQCHSYCLMDNHYHLLIETEDTNLSKGMQELNGKYAQFINKVFNRSGHLFQGRFKSFLVEKDNYMVNVVIYMMLNPVRAGLVNHPQEWPWSNYHALMGKTKDHFSSSWILEYFSDNVRLARELFKNRIERIIQLEGHLSTTGA